MGKKDKEFAEKFGKIVSHYVRGMISSDELINESMEVLGELEGEMSDYSVSRAWHVIKSLLLKEEV